MGAGRHARRQGGAGQGVQRSACSLGWLPLAGSKACLHAYCAHACTRAHGPVSVRAAVLRRCGRKAASPRSSRCCTASTQRCVLPRCSAKMPVLDHHAVCWTCNAAAPWLSLFAMLPHRLTPARPLLHRPAGPACGGGQPAYAGLQKRGEQEHHCGPGQPAAAHTDAALRRHHHSL